MAEKRKLQKMVKSPGKNARSNQPRVLPKKLEEDQYRKYIKATKSAAKPAKTTKQKVTQKRAEATARDYEQRFPGISRRQPFAPKGYKAISNRDDYQMAIEVANQPAKTKAEKKQRDIARRDVLTFEATFPKKVDPNRPNKYGWEGKVKKRSIKRAERAKKK